MFNATYAGWYAIGSAPRGVKASLALRSVRGLPVQVGVTDGLGRWVLGEFLPLPRKEEGS